jgi:hypothetical protein
MIHAFALADIAGLALSPLSPLDIDIIAAGWHYRRWIFQRRGWGLADPS